MKCNKCNTIWQPRVASIKTCPFCNNTLTKVEIESEAAPEDILHNIVQKNGEEIFEESNKIRLKGFLSDYMSSNYKKFLLRAIESKIASKILKAYKALDYTMVLRAIYDYMNEEERDEEFSTKLAHCFVYALSWDIDSYAYKEVKKVKSIQENEEDIFSFFANTSLHSPFFEDNIWGDIDKNISTNNFDNKPYFDEEGNPIEIIPEKLSGGAEANIYKIKGIPALAKIYKDPDLYKDLKPKIMAMYKYREYVKNLNIAWPIVILYDAHKKFVGFGIKKIGKGCSSLKTEEYADKFSISFRIKYAINLATILEKLLKHDILVIDFNSKNFLVNPNTAEVALVDCDSFLLGKGIAKAIIAEYRSTEAAKDSDITTTAIDKYHVYFVFAIYLFEIFTGVYPFYSDDEWDDFVDRIINGYTIYHHFKDIPEEKLTTRMKQIKNNLKALPRDVNIGFQKTFIHGHKNKLERTTMQEWIDILNKYKQ